MAAGYQQQAQMPGWGTPTPVAKTALPSWFTDHKAAHTDPGTLRIYQMMGMQGPDGTIIRGDDKGGYQSYGGGNAGASRAPNRPIYPKNTPSFGGGPIGTKDGTSQSLNYQTGFNANSQAINEGNIMGRLAKEGAGPQSRFSGVNDLRRSQQANDAAQTRRGIQQENSQQFMNNQAARSEVLQTAVSNMAKMYADMGQRNIDQMSLATQLQQAMIRNRSNLMTALTQQQPIIQRKA